jgi:hypothetical protein
MLRSNNSSDVPCIEFSTTSQFVVYCNYTKFPSIKHLPIRRVLHETRRVVFCNPTILTSKFVVCCMNCGMLSFVIQPSLLGPVHVALLGGFPGALPVAFVPAFCVLAFCVLAFCVLAFCVLAFVGFSPAAAFLAKFFPLPAKRNVEGVPASFTAPGLLCRGMPVERYLLV